MIRSYDGTSWKRVGGLAGDRTPSTGFQRLRAKYTAVGGETSINTTTLTPSISYLPGQAQITVKRSSGGFLMSGIDFLETSATTIGFPIADPLLAGEIVEITTEFSVTGVLTVAPRPDVYTAKGVASQTLINATFSWPYNLNSSYSQGAVLVYINGVLQSRGTNYTEVSLGQTNTNQITLVSALAGGENIVMLPAYQALDQSSATSTFVGAQASQLQGMMSAGTQSFIDQTTLITVPNTTITGRAQIPNVASDLRVSFGGERIAVQSIYTIQGEFGPNGEPVYGAVNDTNNLVRFVGTWSNTTDANGVGPSSSTNANADYIEVTFYGTGLDLLGLATSSNTLSVSVDGGATTSVTFPSLSAAIYNRNYNTNQVIPVATGLSLAIHTVKILSTAAASFRVYGFNVNNANSSANLNINPGTSYLGGQKYSTGGTLSPGWNTPVANTKGGRVLVYQNSNGTVTQTYTQVPSSPTLYPSVVSHTSEELVRGYYPREFGASRTNDDWSTLTTVGRNAAFTLEDGTTSLVGASVAAQSYGSQNLEGIYPNASNATIIFTFVGTGLDILLTGVGTSSNLHSIAIDGTVLTSSLTPPAASTWLKVCSGLPYGTHNLTLKQITGTGNPVAISKFNVYQPKKPALPVNAVELADYNVLANFAANTIAGLDTVSTGVIRKQATREFNYVNGTGGSSWSTSFQVPTRVGGISAENTDTNGYFEYTFFGTGFDLRWRGEVNRSNNATITLKDSSGTYKAFNSTNFAGVQCATAGTGVTYGGSTGTFAIPATNTLNQQATSTSGCSFSANGLTLGMYTLRVTNGSGLNVLDIEAIDIVTPIHSARSNIYSDVQEALSIGSCSINDSRKSSMIKESLPATKAWAQAFGVTSSPTTTSTALVPMPDMSLTMKTTGGAIEVFFESGISVNTAGHTVSFQLYVDGAAVSPGISNDFAVINSSSIVTYSVIVPAAAGVHKIDMYWASDSVSNTCTATNVRRILKAREI